jgi:hypothetical protein
MISPGSSASSSTLTISAASTPPPGGYGGGMAALLPGLGVIGTLVTSRKRKMLTRKSILPMSALGLILLISLFAFGCGGSSNNKPPVSQVNVTVTGTSGSLSHSTPVAITIN